MGSYWALKGLYPDPDPNPNPGIDCNLYPTHVDCLEEEPEPIAPGLINVLSELPDEQITVTFWHVYGQGKADLLLEYIAQFEEMYPNAECELNHTNGFELLDKMAQQTGCKRLVNSRLIRTLGLYL